jgi:energy-coupling factor transporter ATP-binding protein EcfA2
MEERHWWFANKLQETFKFGGFDSPTLLEDFLADTDVCELLNKFLGPGEPRKLFFYCDKVTHGSSAPRKLHLTPRLSHDVAKYYGLCFYVLRKEPNWEIDVNDMEKELICGEVRFSGLSTFTLLLSEAFLPLLEANKEWGQCSEEEVTQFLSTLDKFLGILSDMSTVQEAKRPVLEKAKVPSIRLGPLSSSTTSSVVPEIVNDLEGLVAEWINTIDRFLADAVEDRQIDPSSVPLNEVKKWKHRLLLLTSIVEQIKSKDCSGIITILVAAKSKLLKKWKSVDSNLTKAYNDARSKTRFLEYLQPFFEELSSSSNPSHVAKVTLPHLCSTLSQPAAIPYAKSGYLGVLMSKVTNSLVQVCLRAVTLATVRKKGNVARVEEDRFWDEVEDATSAEASNSISKVSGSQPTSSSLMALLSTFQQLKGTYRQLLLKLKEDLQGSISLPGVVSALGSSRGLGASSSTTHLSPLIGRHTKEKKGKSLDVSFDLGAPSLSPLSAGISLTNVDIIMQNLVDFCTRAGQLHSVIQSMGQFKAFSTCSVGLPHAPHAFWDLSPPVLSEIKSQQSAVQIEVKKKTVSKDSLLHRVLKTGEVEDGDPITEDEGIDTDTLSRTSTPEDHKQSNVIQIASEVFVMDEGVLEEDGGQGQIAVASSQQVGNESLFSEQKNDVSMRSEVDQVPVDDEVLHQVEEGSPRALVNHRLSEIMFSLRRCNPAQFSSANHLTTAFLIFSTHGEHEEIFKTTFGDFLSHVDRLEKDITTYIHHLFQQKMPSVVALGYVDKFGPLHSRAASLRPALYEATVGILRLYVNELEELQNHYEQHKASPQGLRGAPKVVKAVSWSRELYDRISKPMKIFSRNKSIAHTNEHSYSIKLYNKFSLALVRFEDQWVDQWRTGVAAKAKAVNNTLLERVVPPGTQGSGIVQVNPSVECLLEVLEEAKGLAKLNVAIPESTRSLINQESRIKGYKHHLDEIVKMFYSTCKSVDSSLMLLLQPHAAQVLKALQPGWSTLTWNSLNIDAFLHQAYSTLEHLREVAACVGDISRDKVKPKLKELSQLSILEYDKLEGVAWLPKDFLQSVCKQAASASRLVSEVVSQAESGVIEILEETQKMEALVLPSFSPSKPSSRQPKTATKHTITGKKGKLTSTKASTTKDKVLKKEITKVEDAVQQSSQAVVGTPHSQYQSRDQSSKTNSNARTPQSQPPTGKSLSILLCTQFAHSTAVHEVVADFNRQMMNSLKAAVVSCLDLLHHSLATSHSSNKCAQKGNDEEDVTTSGILFTLGIQFFIPQVAMQPSLAELCATVDKATNAIIDSCARVGAWTPPPTERRPVSVVTAIRGDPDVAALQRKVVLAIRNLEKPILEHLDSLSPFDPLWQRDLHATYRAFLEENPTVDQCTREVDLHHAVEKKVSLIPEKFVVCCVHLTMEPMKHTLLSLARAWKIKFSSYLHQLAKGLLDDILLQHKDFTVKLGKEVETLENLRDSINLLHDIMDLENVIDNKFLEVEKLYSLLKEHEIRLPRQECQQVSTLRVDWKEIMELAERVQHSLLAKRRIHFEHLVDSEVQSFNVDSNQFHNSFDSEGPLVPGLSSTEAVRRLGIFLGRYREFQEKADLLNVVQRQLDMQVTPFSELVRTGEDLAYLNTLYDTYQKFIEFNERFQEQLWAQVDLKKAISRVEGFWQKCQSLPPEQQHWEASKKLTQKISHCRDLLPLLLRLHGKEICTRHWLQVMTVTGCTLQLEANVFRLKHLVASKLLDHQTDIEAIIESAQHEQNLENQLNDIKEEWTEQLLQFETYKSHGKVLLSQSFTRGLLEQLEHAHTSLSIMLKSTYIRPHRDEAAQWSLKLTSISDVLLKWLSVQELWQSLEAVFSNEKAMKEFADEVVKFSTLNTSWLKLMGSASETRNAINCCLSDDITKNKLLDQLQQEMEECKKSLSSYLSAKKKSFPRFNFISDSVLLGILSATNAVESIRPYLPSLFGSISEVGITHLYDIDHGSWPVVSSVSSFEGETLELAETVVLGGDLESWLSAVIGEVKTTLQGKMSTAIAEIYEALSEKENKFEGFVRKHHCQVACVAAHYYWTQETSKALEVCRYDRRAVPSTKSRFNMMVVNKLTAILGRGKWKNPECVLSHLDRTKLEVLAVFSIALRDMSEDLVHRKLRDVSDFEWQRFPRVNSLSELTITEQLFTAEQENTEELVEGHSNPGPLSLVVDCLDTSFLYAYEYLGCKLYPVFTPRTLNCIVAFTQSLMKYSGCELAGPVGSGKKGFVDGLGMLYGRHVFFVHCNQLTSPSIIRSIMEGSSQCGSWSCFVGVTELRSEVLSLLAHLLQVITTALKAKERTFTLPTGQQVPVLEGFGTFVTRTDVAKAVSLPSYIREHFRSFTLSFPPPGILFRVNAAILGYKQPRLLADRLVMMHTLIHEQIPDSTLSLQSLVTVLRVMARRQQQLAKRCYQPQQQQQQQQQQEEREHQPDLLLQHSPQRSLEEPPGTISSHSVASPLHPSEGAPVEVTTTQVVPFRLEHVLVVRGIVEIIMPQFPESDLPVFTAVLRDTFSGVVDASELDSIIKDGNHLSVVSSQPPKIASNPLKPHESKPRASLGAVSILKKNITEEDGGIFPILMEQLRSSQFALHPPWLAKVSQVVQALSSMHAVVLCGGAGTGKSTCIDAIISAENTLRSSEASNDEGALPVKLHKIFPRVFPSPPELYGMVNDKGEWSDGVFSALLRKTLLAQQSVSWYSFDGPLDTSWVDYLSSLLDSSRVFEHPNGDHLSIRKKDVKFIFETGDIKDTSPVVLTHCGLVHFDPSTLDWRVLVNAWLDTRKPHEVQCLRKYIDTIIDPVCQFVLKKLGRGYCMAGIINTTLSYLTSLLNMYAETAEAFSESHVERLFLFAVIWGCGGPLDEELQVEFSNILKKLTNGLPDDDSVESVFEYYVDESGEWDVWQTCVPRVDYSTQLDPINGLFIETDKTICIKVLLDLALRAKQHVMLVGASGSGKSTVTNNFLSQRGASHSKTESLRKIAMNEDTRTQFLHTFMKLNFHRRQGQTYGPYQGRVMDLFIDDLHLPSASTEGSVIEFIRQLVDVHGLYNLSRQHEWSHVEDFVIFATAGSENKQNKEMNRTINDPRAKRHFAVMRFPTLQGSDVRFLVEKLAEGYLLFKGEGTVLTKEIVFTIASVTLELYSEVCSTFSESSLPGRQHYMFSLHHVALLYQGLHQCLQSVPHAAVLLPSLWIHEGVRVFCDSVSRERDYMWFHTKVNHLSQDIESEDIDVEIDMDFIAVTSLPLVHKSMSVHDSDLNAVKKVNLSPISHWDDLRSSLTQYLTRYQEEHGPLDLTLSDINIQYLVRLHRSFTSSNSSGHVVIGALGTPRDELIKLALYIAGCTTVKVTRSTRNPLEHAKQGLFQQAGLEKKKVSVIINERNMRDPGFLQVLASFLSCGEFPVSFTSEEEDGLRQAVGPSIKRDFPGRKVEPLQYFNRFVQNNLCVVISIPSDHELVNGRAK